MADVVDSQVMVNNPRKYVVRLTNVSDGTGESLVVKVDRSTLTNSKGTEPGALLIRSVQWSINGFSSVRFYWDAATDDEALMLATGNGYMDFTEFGGGLQDPLSATNVGDLLLTTAGNTSGATYTIVLELIKGN